MTTKWALLFLATLSACGSTAASPSAADGGDASADASDSGPQQFEPDGAVCPSTDEPFRRCVSPSDCTLAGVPDCPCGGSHLVIGVAKASAGDYGICMKQAFDASLARDGVACGSCVSTSDCVAEDGRAAQCVPGRTPLDVTCTAGRCTSFVLPDAGADGG